MTIFLIILSLFALFLIADTMQKRELAINFGKNLTAQFQLQFLDDSIYCSKIKFVKGIKYPLSISRKYNFYASPFNERRLLCNLEIVGGKLKNWYIEPYQIQNEVHR
jgi:ABC-type uncharacterized transport system fused permease/ATPase subunit